MNNEPKWTAFDWWSLVMGIAVLIVALVTTR